MGTNEKMSFAVPISILIAGLLIGAAIIYKGDSGEGIKKQNSQKEVEQKIIEPSVDDDPSLGSPNAPVTVINFFDYRCGYCARFVLDIEKEIIEKYVKTGKVKFVARDFAFLNDPRTPDEPLSTLAAEASECADEQERYWDYRDYLFSRQSEITSKESLKKFAEDLGLNSAQFNACLDSRKYKTEVEKDLLDGRSYGVNSTPSTFINGELILGAMPYTEFEKIIEEKLKGVGQ